MDTLTDFYRPSDIHHRDESKVNKRHIGLLVSNECSVTNAGAIGEAFRLANEFEQASGGEPPYRLSVLSESGGFITSSSSISIWTQKLETYALMDFHAFFVACRDTDAAGGPDDRLLSWMSHPTRDASLRSQPGANSVFDPKNLARSPVPIFWFKDAPVADWSTTTTPADMALAQIERDLSADTARRIARVLQPHAVQRTKPDLDDLNARTTTEKIHESARWIKENYSKPISVAQAAESAAMSKRNYLRRFKSEFGVTPLEYLIRTRFEIVCTLLMDTDLPIDKIARRCGMGDGNRLGRLFRQRFGVSPMHFRSRGQIRAGAQSLNAADAKDAMSKSSQQDAALLERSLAALTTTDGKHA
ncbi:MULTISPECIES: helix-turn-helix domain-containing protein [Burkholderiaceae]|uniref:Transcriptional regulator containing an amidase domain and an AraC-type DNA-binding HTH domain n=1 Tax=Caballeronia sordidicola TaxID=196367 RepID=A0A242MB33_CABSO|nr:MULTISPECIES: helix-turn-helix domain-containing protein [Burkholderiaceae]OTP68349.1 Transcriptional regulator containing an amidase domain and an AraC-type DNA-binding HTH domain [Caballeronia sordidicola]